MTSYASVPTSFATVSVGYSKEHTLQKKLEAITNAGFTGIELGFPDLVAFASDHLRKRVGEYDYEDLCTAAQSIHALCKAKGLCVMLLQPFANYEGWEEGFEGRKDAHRRLRGWISIMKACKCDTLQVGSTDTPLERIRSDRQNIVADLRELADVLAEDNFRVAYENLCWSTHAPTWRDVWEIVDAVDRPNIGLCLDTFQSAGGEWGDPTTESGVLDDKSLQEANTAFRASMMQLAHTVPAEKIYLLQISDAYKKQPPFIKKPDESGLQPRGQWSHDYRPVPFRGYLPVAAVARAVLATGFRGWFSYEIFDSGPDGRGRHYELDDFLREARQSHVKLLEACRAQ